MLVLMLLMVLPFFNLKFLELRKDIIASLPGKNI